MAWSFTWHIQELQLNSTSGLLLLFLCNKFWKSFILKMSTRNSEKHLSVSMFWWKYCVGWDFGEWRNYIQMATTSFSTWFQIDLFTKKWFIAYYRSVEKLDQVYLFRSYCYLKLDSSYPPSTYLMQKKKKQKELLNFMIRMNTMKMYVIPFNKWNSSRRVFLIFDVFV